MAVDTGKDDNDGSQDVSDDTTADKGVYSD